MGWPHGQDLGGTLAEDGERIGPMNRRSGGDGWIEDLTLLDAWRNRREIEDDSRN